MTHHFKTTTSRVTGVLAVACLFLAAQAHAGTAPEVACGQAVAKAVGKCIKKAVGVHAKCYKNTGADCSPSDIDLGGAADKAAKSVRAKCSSGAIISAAGYGSFTVGNLGSHFGDVCKSESLVVTQRTFGKDGSSWTSADDDGKKCLQNAAKSAGKLLGGSVSGLAKCITTTCTLDFSAAATDAATKLDDKCATFATVVGSTAAAYTTALTRQVPSSVAAPCDPFDTTRCMTPYPNDYYTIDGADTTTGKRVSFGKKVLPLNASANNVDPSRWTELDGFSIGAMPVLNDVNIDLTQTGMTPEGDLGQSLASNQPGLLIDAEDGSKQLIWWERDQRGATIADQPIIGRVGKNLKDGHRYIVALRNMKDSSGNPVTAPASFALYRDSTATHLMPVEARRPHMEDILTILTNAGIARSELYLAWDFTTQSSDSVSGKLLAMRDDAYSRLGAGTPAFTVDTVTEPLDGQIFRQVDGTFQVPLYLTDNGIPGSSLRVDANGTPYNSGDFFTADYRCIIPYSATTGGAAPAIPARVSLYGHGLLGSHTEVSSGNVRNMAYEHDFVFCATDWTGFADGDTLFVASVLGDFSDFPKFIDRQHQGMLNMMFLGRLLKDPNGFASNAAFQVGGESMLDNSNLFYDGNSQGGILGGVLAAFETDATRFVLGVPGINYSTLLFRSVDFEDYDPLFQAGYPAVTDRTLVFSLAQSMWDRTDPNGHITHVLSNPYAGTPAKKILYQVAFGDHQVAPVTVEVAARSNGMYIHQPAVDPLKPLPGIVTPYYGIPAVPHSGGPTDPDDTVDASAMVIWDSGNPAPPQGDIPPAVIGPMDAGWTDLGPCPQGHGSDPHSCPRSNATARSQKSAFLQGGGLGMLVDVCSGAPCTAP